MSRLKINCAVLYFAALLPALAHGADFAYLDEFCDPYYVGRDFPKLTTPQWVGEEGVEAVVVLSIDDMRGHEKWEAYLRPIIDRMKKTQGRAAISIMTNRINPDEPHLQKWLKEGLSIEVHTIDHPCPCLQASDFDRAAKTYHDCVDLMGRIPGSQPVAFRMPCCDSQNTPSPRFYAEIFNKKSSNGNFLQIDSSVFNVITPNDESLPRDLVVNEEGKPRFDRYLPFPSFVNTIEDYPYPYVIGRKCWQFPCVVPSDWEAQHVQRPNNPNTVADMQRALDAIVLKQGVFTLVFHPHGWIRNDQINELNDHAEKKYGNRVKFLNFRDCAERISKHLLAGETLRTADGGDNGVRLLDVNNDGFLDVVIGNDQKQLTRVWLPKENRWSETAFPTLLVQRAKNNTIDTGVRFGVLHNNGFASCIVQNESAATGWHFDGQAWKPDERLLAGLTVDDKPIRTSVGGVDQGVRLRDLDGDGRCELVAGGPKQGSVFAWDETAKSWQRLSISLPKGVWIVDKQGRDAGLRFDDINADGRNDIVFSNEKRWSAHLFDSMEAGWTQSAAAERAADDSVPPIVRGATNNGAWFHSGHLWVQNEDTHRLPDGVARMSFASLLEKIRQDENGLPLPKTPQDSLQSIKVRPGLKVQLVAAEPLVVDPVAFDWGPDGRLWVVEMRDYPNGTDGKGAPGGQVKVLTDTDDDGRYDKASLFLDGLPFPTGVKVWRGGILITAAPRIIYAEDTNNDGRANKVQTLYEGFGEGNQQHRVNGLRWGLDNWLYVGNGDSGGRIRSLKTGETVDVARRDLRIQPDTGGLQAISGSTQFGINRDDWGNWFGGNNSTPAWHYVLDDVYLRRNPHFAPPAVRREISATPGAARVYPISRTLARFNNPNSANHFTSACSPTIYRDRLLGEEYYGNIFVCEPVHNLVHREIVTANGVTFNSRRADDEQESEFLASSDNWFRPTMVRTGPDGALWVADMYRLVIEHPEWIPQDWQERLDVRSGADRGRIYRIVPDQGDAPRVPRLDQLDAAGLAKQLESSNGTVRDLAHQLIIWRGARAADILPAWHSETPQARFQALCALDGAGVLTRTVVNDALSDEHPAVRRHAVRISEASLRNNPALTAEVARLADDADPLVRLQVAYSAGNWADAELSGEALAKLIHAAGSDPYLRAAAISSLSKDNVGQVIAALLSSDDEAAPQQHLGDLLAQAVALGAGEALLPAVGRLGRPNANGEFSEQQLVVAARVLAQFDNNDQLVDASKNARERLAPLMAFARERLKDNAAGDDVRVASLALLHFADPKDRPDTADLISLLEPQHAPGVQSAAAASLAAQADDDAIGKALAGWRGYSPSLRAELLDAMLARDALASVLLDALEKTTIASAQLDADRRRRLLEHPNEKLRQRAKALLSAGMSSSRAEVVKQFATALELNGDAAAGREVFAKSCASCHRLEEKGNDVGPDLATLTNRSPEALLEAILDPSRAVEDKFLGYTAVLNDGRVQSGMLAAEAGASLTLRAADGKSVTLLRKDIETLASNGKSFMPEGLEQDVSPQALADVIAYVRSAGMKSKSFAGNLPALVRADDKGILHATAATAHIYGSRLIFEPQYKNLGWWQSEDDHAAWTLAAPAAGRYKVEIDYACHANAAGDAFVMQFGKQELSGKVESTGTWDDYRWRAMGEIELSAGQHELVVRSIGPIHSALIDLREVRLTPIPQ